MKISEKAVQWIKQIAADNSHGYDQTNRWGPNYDCSSLVISSYKQAGVNLACTYTGNMRNDMLAKGFKLVDNANLVTGAGLLPGDVLLNTLSHTAMYVGNGQIVHAAGNEFGGVVGGAPGDQTGGEICMRSYYNFPWDYVLRYSEEEESHSKDEKEIQNGTYTVQYGDTLWGISERFLGNGSRYIEIKALNNLVSDDLYAGMVLRIPGLDQKPKDQNVTMCNAKLPVLKRGMVSMSVRKVQTILKLIGYDLDIDGDFGEETACVVNKFKSTKGLSQNGEVDSETWHELFI